MESLWRNSLLQWSFKNKMIPITPLGRSRVWRKVHTPQVISHMQNESTIVACKRRVPCDKSLWGRRASPRGSTVSLADRWCVCWMQYEYEKTIAEFGDEGRPARAPGSPARSRRQGADTVPHVLLRRHGSCLGELRYPQKARHLASEPLTFSQYSFFFLSCFFFPPLFCPPLSLSRSCFHSRHARRRPDTHIHSSWCTYAAEKGKNGWAHAGTNVDVRVSGYMFYQGSGEIKWWPIWF